MHVKALAKRTRKKTQVENVGLHALRLARALHFFYGYFHLSSLSKSIFYVACLTMALNATCSLAALQDTYFIRGSVPLKLCLLWVSYRSEVITYNLYLNLILLPLGIPNFFLIFDVAADIYLLTGLIYLLFPLAHEDFFFVCFSRTIHEAHKHTITVGGLRIHALLQSTFEVSAINLRR